MKKKIAAIAFSIACILLLSACAAMIPTNFSANWLKDPSDTHDPSFYEKLEYGVKFNSSEMKDSLSGFKTDGEQSSFSIETEVLSSFSHNSQIYERVYHMTAQLTMSGSFAYTNKDGATELLFSFGGEHDTPSTDADDAASVKTEVWFYSLDDGKNLQPIYSTSSYFSYSPAGLNGKMINIFNYSYEIEYDDDCSEAIITYHDNYKDLPEEERKVNANLTRASLFAVEQRRYGDLQKSHTCIDHAQLLFAIRGINYKENTSVGLTSVSGEIGKQTLSIACKEFVESTLTFMLDGDTQPTERKIPCAKIEIGISGNGTNTGGMHSVLISKRDEKEAEHCYAVPVRIESPFGFGLGTMVYELKSVSHVK